MKATTWSIVLGVIIILLGGCSALTDYSQINMRKNYALHQEMMEKMADSDESTPLRDMAETMNDMTKMSEYTLTWIVRFGYIGLCGSLLYVFSGIFLIVPKPFSLKLAFSAIGLSVLISVFQWIVLKMDDSPITLMSLSNSINSGFGIFVDLILIVVLLSANKSDLRRGKEEEKNTNRQGI